MRGFKQLETPFTVQTPEDMHASDAWHLFVNVFSDFPKVPNPGHLFLRGPRGSGKSMMFRYMQPDCQILEKKCRFEKLPFYSVYIPIKNAGLNLTDLARLEKKHASILINEHFMCSYVATRLFMSLLDSTINGPIKKYASSIRDFAIKHFFRLLDYSGWRGDTKSFGALRSTQSQIGFMKNVCEELFRQVIRYLKGVSFVTTAEPFETPLCGYLDFLYPLMCELKRLPFMPEGPIFLLVDDADNLSETQTMILNSWVSTRTSHHVSLKISTQHQYKTFQTTSGQRIATPHDYSEINISTTYTSSKKHQYRNRVREIVKKRLELAGIRGTSPEAFFPPDVEQEKAIRKLEERYVKEWKTTGRGFCPSDDAKRYARPEYMKSLAGTSKSSHTYSYAGFDQLVHISSGIVRYFLDSAATMYSEAKARPRIRGVKFIPPHIQDMVVRQDADDFMFLEFDKLSKGEGAPSEENLQKLNNLIRALGGTFRLILLSDRSERRVFSIAFSDVPNKEIQDILRLGEECGYFHVSSIGNKEGTGRTKLFILSRRLAPYFNLDPTSFAGYLFVASDVVFEAMKNPNALLRRIKSGGIDGVFETGQLKLFD